MSEPYNQALAEQIATQIPGLDATQVAVVMQTWRDVLDGDPVGTVRRSEDGKVAHRVATDGVFLWRVTAPDGDQYNDMTPALAWPAIYTPESAE